MGRPLGSKNKLEHPLPNDLLEELRDQDKEFVGHDNRKVLDVANGSNDSGSSESEDESDIDYEVELTTEKVRPSTVPPPPSTLPPSST